jgi:hypothetical protein
VATSAATTEEAPDSPQLVLAKGELERFRAGVDAVRSRADLTAKGVSALAATGLSAIGLAKIADVFPYEGPWVALVGLFVAFTAMALAALLYARRTWQAQEPLVMATDEDKIESLSNDERAKVKTIFDQLAHLNRVDSLAQYEQLYQAKVTEAGKTTSDPKRKKLTEDAALIQAEIQATFARAALAVVQTRTASALRDGLAVFLLIVFFVGLIGFGISADALESRRSGEVALAKSCAEARTAGAADLPQACGAPPAAPKTPPTKVSAKAIADLASARKDCLAAAEDAKVPPAACDAINRALQAALAGQ